MIDLLAVACCHALARLPWSAALWFGRALGRAGGLVARRKRRRIESNLAAAGSDDPRKARARCWTLRGMALGEMLWSLSQRPESVALHVRASGLAALREAASAGRGVLLVSGHVGNWELVPLVAAREGLAVAVVARRIRTPRLERLLWAFRERCGVRTLVRGEGSSVAAYRWLRRGGVLGCMVDRASSGRRIAVPFLGRSTKTLVGPALLAHRTGAAVVLGRALRLADGSSEVTFRRLEVPHAADENELAVVAIRALEQELRDCPEQWHWIDRRQAPWIGNSVAARSAEGEDATMRTVP